MRITIDNRDGLGAVDYTGSVCAEGRLRVERKLNAPSRCTAEIVVGDGGLAMPVRLARVVVTAEDATLLFTGYVTTEPVRVVAGAGTEGLVYRARLTAVSDEWLLDKQGSGAAARSPGGVSLSLDGLSLMQRLAGRAGGGLTVTGGTGAARTTGTYTASAGVPWSVNAGAAAGAAYAGYRALAGEVLVQPAGEVTHAFSDADGLGGSVGSLDVKALALGSVRELANDVTLTGEHEPAAYVQECLCGDGTTAEFTLSGPVFGGAGATVLEDAFDEADLDTAVWAAGDPGSHLSLTSAGLTMSGGNGADGVTMLTALDLVEMGGTLVVELNDVVLGAGCDGMLGGLYRGVETLAYCFAGFRVRQQAGVTAIVPVMNGVEVGDVLTVEAGHKYRLRLRLHCGETQRVPQRYYSMVDGVVQSFGSGSGVAAPMDAVFEAVDLGVSSYTPAQVLWDSAAALGGVGAVTGTPAVCLFCVANCAEMFGSVGSVRVTRPGTLWAVSTLPGGAKQTRLLGLAGEGLDAVVVYGEAPKLTFFAGRVPEPNERITVIYRSGRRSVARLADAASVAAEAVGGAAGTCRWLGAVLGPAARSSVDCESAAQAVLAFASSRAAAVAGTYATVNPAGDLWPGDVLAVTSAGVTTSLLVRSVAVEDGGAVPEVRQYKVAFANDWATELEDGLGLRLSESVAGDAELPEKAANAPAAVLANLQQLAVTSLSGSVIELDAGIDPPVGGGFEVRRRDWAFGPVSDADLLLRSPVRSFSFPRVAEAERYFVRMYDAGSPRLYSRFSAAVLVNWPVG